MDINVFCDYACLVNVRNFSTAADIQGITKSGLSRRIKSLEDYVGARLIDRERSPIELTPAGEQMNLLAVSFLKYLRDAEDATELSFLTKRFRSKVFSKIDHDAHRASSVFINQRNTKENTSGDMETARFRLPVVGFGRFRSLTTTGVEGTLSDSLSTSLLSHLTQSVYVDCIDRDRQDLAEADMLIEATVSSTQEYVHFTLSLVDKLTSKLIMSRSFKFDHEELSRSIDGLSQEFTWSIITKIRNIYYKSAQKTRVQDRTNYANFVTGLESIFTSNHLEPEVVLPACQQLERNRVDIHRVAHVYGYFHFARWLRELRSTDDLELAERHFHQGYEDDPQYAPILMLLANLNCYKRQFGLARDYIELWSRTSGRSSLGLLGKAVVEMALGSYQQALINLSLTEKFEVRAHQLGRVYSALMLFLLGQYADSAAKINVAQSPFPDAIAIKLAALAQIRKETEYSSLLDHYHKQFPTHEFRLERFPLSDKDAELRLIDGLKRVGIKPVSRAVPVG